MNIGILGTGFGYHHAALYKKVTGIDSITIFGRDSEKLKKIEEELTIKITDDINELISDPSIDLIDICLPTSLHKQYVLEALQSGKHVFCETPLCMSMEDAYELKVEETRAGKHVFVNQFIKHEMPYEYLNTIKETRELGELMALHIKRKTLPLWGNLSLDTIATDLIIHDFDFITWLLGSPNHIKAQGVSGRIEESHVQAILTYADTIVSVEGSSMMPYGHPFRVGYDAIFEEGVISYQEDSYKESEIRTLTKYSDNKVEKIPIVPHNCYEESLKEVVASCKEGTPTRLGLQSAIDALDLAIKVKEQIVRR